MKADLSPKRAFIDEVWQRQGDDTAEEGRAGEWEIIAIVVSGKEAGTWGIPELSALWAVSGDFVVPAHFLLPTQHLLPGDRGGGREKWH